MEGYLVHVGICQHRYAGGRGTRTMPSPEPPDLISSARGEEGPLLPSTGPPHAMQCRIADPPRSPNSPQRSVSVTANTSLARSTQIPSFSCAQLRCTRTALRRSGGGGSRQGGPSASVSPARRTAPNSGSVFPRGRGQARSLVLVRRWMVQFPWVRHGGENGGGIVVVWSGLSNCTGLKVHA